MGCCRRPHRDTALHGTGQRRPRRPLPNPSHGDEDLASPCSLLRFISFLSPATLSVSETGCGRNGTRTRKGAVGWIPFGWVSHCWWTWWFGGVREGFGLAHAKTRRRETVQALSRAGTWVRPRRKANASRCRVPAFPTPTALRPLAQGWPRNEDNPGFEPNAGANRIAVVATTDSASPPTTASRTTQHCSRAIAPGPEGRQTIAQRVSAGFRSPHDHQSL